MKKQGSMGFILDSASKEKWKRIGLQKRAGVLVPLFSVYSENSLGVGDFEDLKVLISWCKEVGESIIQLLPLNEVGPLFCPYDSLSSFALEPMYISLGKLPHLKKKSVKERMESLKDNFSVGRPYVDYRIKEEKIKILRDIFLYENTDKLAGFNKFKEKNSYWLDDFALYKVIKEFQNGKPWYEWEDKYKNRDRGSLKGFVKQHYQRILFHMWVQWRLYKQLKDAKDYAHSKGVFIKGDLPILVSRDSADVWAHPEFFKLEYTAGAPPDMYCAKGQRWGMPPYNWKAKANSEFRYLKEKLGYAGNFYDILRIDHVVGLFRIWSIPYSEPIENQGLNGSFDPLDEKEWGPHGRKIINVMLQSTDMLLCAEDLGVIPQVCTDTLKELGIPGNNVQRWVKDWESLHDFLRPSEYRAVSVAMLSTHDTTNWAAWWENEAGTVDEMLFMRKCCDHRSIGFQRVWERLFDKKASGRGRLRWLNKISSVEMLVSVLDRKKEEVKDFIDMYENTYKEKEKLWRQLGVQGQMREKADEAIIAAALEITHKSSAMFCIELITDLLLLYNVFKGDFYDYRINKPGTISDKNWSLVMPISLEDLLKHPANKKIRKIIKSGARALG